MAKQKDAPAPTGPGITRDGSLIISPFNNRHLEFARRLAEWYRDAAAAAKPTRRKRRNRR
jgi:hypothetical protein